MSLHHLFSLSFTCFERYLFYDTDASIFETRVSRNPVFGGSYHVRYKPAAQWQKMARGLEYRIYEVEGVHSLSSI